MMWSGRRRMAAGAVVAVLVTVAGCADDGDDAAPATAATSVDSEATAPTASSAPGAATVAPTARSDAPGTGTAATTAASTPPTSASPSTAPPSTEPLGDPAVTLTQVAELDQPVDVAWRDGDDGAYVVEQPGRVVRLAPDGGARTVLDITDLTAASGERGFLGLAFAPNGDLAYVNYIDGGGDTMVAELAVGGDGTFDRGSQRAVYTADQPYPNHNGGDLAFGPDGLLYIGLGDGGSAGDPERRASSLASPLGKMLRIDPAPAGDRPYTVPEDNPFVDAPEALGEIWSYGLRNPWRYSFDTETGDLWIGDVGQSELEEIDVAPATNGLDAGRGLNFGWSAFEAEARFNEDVSPDGHTPPIFSYSHDAGCSISGGERYRASAIPALVGRYVYADYCSGTVWALDVRGEGQGITASGTITLGEVPNPTAVASRPDGELLVLSKSGPVYLVEPG